MGKIRTNPAVLSNPVALTNQVSLEMIQMSVKQALTALAIPFVYLHFQPVLAQQNASVSEFSLF